MYIYRGVDKGVKIPHIEKSNASIKFYFFYFDIITRHLKFLKNDKFNRKKNKIIVFF